MQSFYLKTTSNQSINQKVQYAFFLILLLLPFFLQAQNQPCKEVIGYYPGWQWYDRNKLVRPATIKYDKYTILNYAFFKPLADGSIVGGDSWADENILKGQINWSTTPTSYYPNTSLVDLAHNNNVKVLISVGGWSWSDEFPQIAASPAKRAKFAGQCKYWANYYNLDGMDIDWEYPGYAVHSGTAADKQNFTILLQTIRDSLTQLGTQTNKTYILTACVGASQSNMANIEWNNISTILDAINLMSYDFFGTWDSVTNHNAPLSTPAQGDPTFNVTAAVNYLLTNYNVPPNKLTAGVAFYGRSAKTVNAAGLHVPQTGTTDNITFSLDDGSPTYYNVLDKQNLFTTQYDAAAQVPYLTGNAGLNTFVSYDDPSSITLKANFIKSKNLKGAIIWEITGDYVETALGSGVIAGTPLADALKTAFCNTLVVCAAPNNLVATPSTTNAVLTWTAGNGTAVELQYKLSSATTWTTASSTLTTNTYTLSNLTTCTQYDVRLKSICASSSSNYTNLISFTTTGCASPCNAPTNLAVTPSSSSAILTWTTGNGISTELQYKLASATTWTTASSTLTNNTFTLGNLMACSAYEVRLKSVCPTISSNYTNTLTFTTTGCGGGGGTGTGITSTCTSPTSFFFNANNYIPLAEIKIGQGRLYPIWGVSVDAYIPNNRLEWAISMVHAAHLFRNVTNTAAIPANFYFATAAKESFCGCDQGINAAPTGSAYPFTFQTASTGDGCFQIENLSAYTEMTNMYPQRFPAGQHPNLIGNANFCTAALGKAYYDIFTVKYWDVHKGWNPIGFFNQATDVNAAIKLMAVAYNRGLWYPSLQTVLKDDRPTAITSTTISPYFSNNSYGYDYQNALTTYTRVLENQANTLPASATAINPQTNQPSNFFNSFYDPQVTWTDMSNYIDKIMPLYPTINSTTLKATVQATFNGINAGNSISFRTQLGQVLNTLLLNLPADDPSANIATTYGCYSGTSNQPPTVTLTSPTNNTIYTAPATVALAATASDPDGTIAKVEFYQGTTLLGTSTTAPYFFSWTNVAAGTYSISAKAYDNIGATTTSTAITIVVNTILVNTPPTVTLTNPTNSAIYTAPATISLAATASDPNGSIVKVEFYKGTTLIGTSTTAPYTFPWVNVAVGTYVVTAKAYDNQGATATSNAATIVVNAVPANLPPIVSITSPVNNAQYNSPATIAINAKASDPDGTIAKVVFYNGTTVLGTDLSAPYSFIWQNVAAGTYNLTARAYDNLGANTYSSIVVVKVVKPLPVPTIAISSPANNAQFTAPATIGIKATATITTGTITKVEFYESGNLIGTDLTAPYTFSWTNVLGGTYLLTAKAYASNGTTNTSIVKVISVIGTANQPPTCSLTSNTATGVAPASVNLTATASDPDGTISKVDIYQNQVLIATLTTAPYTYIVGNLAAGTYLFTAKAFDNNNASTVSNSITVIVQSPVNQPPTCSLASNTTTGTAPASVNLTATASDPDGTISKVEIYQDQVLIATLTTAPYTYTVGNLAAGTYLFTAKAFDNNNASTVSNSITVIVQSPVNQPPTCSLASNTTTGTVPASVNLTATASDPNGTVVKVEIYQDQVLIATLTASPYTYTVGNLAAGTYIFTAKAFDNNNASTVSNAITITIASGNVCTGIAVYTANAPYQQGSQVQNNNSLYTCDVPGWCSGAATAYAPGTGWAWQQAWTLNGNCGTTTAQPPTVTWSSPTYNTIYTTVATVPASAAFSTPTGTITLFEIVSGSTVLGSIQNPSASPATVSVVFQAAGIYPLAARVTNSANLSTTSATTQIIVQQSSGACNANAWNSTTIYLQGDRVSYNGSLWQTQWWTQGDVPTGTTPNPSLPWINLGPCTTAPTSNGNRATQNATAILYPNPSNDLVNLSLRAVENGDVSIEIIDQLGRIVQQQNTTIEDNRLEKTLNIEHLPSGLYNVVIHNKMWIMGVRMIRE